MKQIVMIERIVGNPYEDIAILWTTNVTNLETSWAFSMN